jgi:hypothetical protein
MGYRVRTRGFLLLIPGVVLFGMAEQSASGARPLRTAIVDPILFGGPNTEIAFARTVRAGATSVRLILSWPATAPAAAAVTKPARFDASDPSDRRYRWSSFDRQVRLARAKGLEPIVNLNSAPRWAQRGDPDSLGATRLNLGPIRPISAELRQFARAAALRYSGSFRGLPRVRYWMLWNEPNLIFNLLPQRNQGRAVSPELYREMLAAFAAGVRAVRRDNIVVAGALAPFTSGTGDKRLWGIAPLRFMRLMLCMSKRLAPTCRTRSHFDVWAHHPYTSGGPTRKALLADNVSLGNLPEMNRLLRAADKAGHIVARRPVRFWVTEFSWDTSPPDPEGIPLALHARWTAEALYRMWRSGVSLVTWFSVRDEPFRLPIRTSTDPYQAGLYFRGSTMARDRPKPALQAFRFPFVALREGAKHTRVWGRTPTSKPGHVVVERSFAGGWTRAAVLRANSHGIFTTRLPRVRTGSMRAWWVNGGETSLAFRVRPAPDRFFSPFGKLKA